MLSTSIMYALGKDIAALVRMVMDSNVGINTKVSRNTLTNSDIYNELVVYSTNDGDLIFDIVLNGYLQYIESGRRQGAKMPPIKPIEDWARKHGIPTDNKTIWAIRMAISRDGIAPRPFMAHVMEEMDDYWDKGWADTIFDKIIDKINKFFN